MMFSRKSYTSQVTSRWIAVTLALSVGLFSVSRFFLGARRTPSQEAIQPVSEVDVSRINALGKIEPQESISLSPTPSIEGVRLAELRFKEGENVNAGDIVAILDSHDRLQASLQEAQEQVALAQARLAQVKAGAKLGEIEAQRAIIVRAEAQHASSIQAQEATIARLEDELRNAEVEQARYIALHSDGAISASLLDSKQLVVETLNEQVREAKAIRSRIMTTGQAQIQEATATLNRITDVRPVDIAVAQAEVDRSIATFRKAEANLELAYVRSPIDGRVLTVHASPGEIIGPEGIVDIAQTESMVVTAEVHEGDIRHVRPGQKTVIVSEYGSFTGQLQGTVAKISSRIGRQSVLGHDPSTEIDTSVVEVTIQLHPEDSQRVQNLTQSHVQVSIHTDDF